MFAEHREILAEDYEHFAGVKPGVPTGRNTARRKSETPTLPPDQELS